MSNLNVMKKISIQKTADSKESRDIGIEAQNGSVSYNTNGEVITDPNVTPTTTKSIPKTIIDINTNLEDKIEQDDFNKKADINSTTGLVEESELPDEVINVVEGYYKKDTGKFYTDNLYTQEIQGKPNKIYIDKATNLSYSWDDDIGKKYYVKIKSNVDVGIKDLTGINIDQATLRDGDSLVYDGISGEWINKMDTVHIVIPPKRESFTAFTYNGNPQGPVITITDPYFSQYVNVRREPPAAQDEDPTKGTNAGNYRIVYELKNNQTSMWADLTTEDKNIDFTINQAEGDIDLAITEVTLKENTTSAAVYFKDNTGTVSVTSSDGTIAAATVVGNDIVIISPTQESGFVTITVNVAASQNYTATSKTIAVTANFVELVGWDDISTNEQITKMVQAYYNGIISLEDIQRVWHVGDTRKVKLDPMSATEVGESHREQYVDMVILDFDHDLLVDTSSGKTKALVTIGQKDCLMDATVTDEQGSSNTEIGYINSTNDNSTGWNTCARRTWCNSVYYNALPSYLKSLVKQIKKSTAATGNTSSPTWYVNHDYCFLPSEWEVFGVKGSSAETGQNATHTDKDASDASVTMPAGGTQYSYYTIASNRYKRPKWNSSYVSSIWWMRSPRTNHAQFCYVYADGDASGGFASQALGIAPSCCI